MKIFRANESTRMRVRTGARLELVIACALVAGAALTSAPASAQLLPPAGDFTVRWYQPNGSVPVRNWQIEVKVGANPSYVLDALATPEPSCWAVSVPVADTAVVRLRAVSGALVSPWTRPTVVPEPAPTAGIAAAGLWLARLARRRASGRRRGRR